MSVSELSRPAAEASLTSPPERLTFAERFRWLGIVANGVLVGGIIVYLLQFPFSYWPSPVETILNYSFCAMAATFPIGWASFVQWKRVRDAWAGLFVPGILLTSAAWVVAVIDPTTALNLSQLELNRVIPFVLVYVFLFGLLWCWGIRLLDRKCLATAWQRGQFSICTIAATTILVAIYVGAARDLAAEGPFRQFLFHPASLFQRYLPSYFYVDDLIFLLVTSHVAILGFALSMSGYVGWSVTALTGGTLCGVSLQLRSPMPYFDVSDPKQLTLYVAMLLLFTAAMALPWVVLGWRVVWTPPLWDRSWRFVGLARQ